MEEIIHLNHVNFSSLNIQIAKCENNTVKRGESRQLMDMEGSPFTDTLKN